MMKMMMISFPITLIIYHRSQPSISYEHSHVCIYLYIYIYLSNNLIYLTHQSINQSIYLSIHPSIHISCCIFYFYDDDEVDGYKDRDASVDNDEDDNDNVR